MCDSGDGFFCCVESGQFGDIFVYQFSNIGEFFWVGDQVVVGYMWQQDSVGYVVWYVVQVVQLVCYGVYVVEVGVIESYFGQQRSIGYVFLCLQIVVEGYGLVQVVGDEVDCLYGGGVCYWVSVFGDIGFYGVGQGIYFGCCGQGGWFIDYQQWIVDRD